MGERETPHAIDLARALARSSSIALSAAVARSPITAAAPPPLTLKQRIHSPARPNPRRRDTLSEDPPVLLLSIAQPCRPLSLGEARRVPRSGLLPVPRSPRAAPWWSPAPVRCPAIGLDHAPARPDRDPAGSEWSLFACECSPRARLSPLTRRLLSLLSSPLASLEVASPCACAVRAHREIGAPAARRAEGHDPLQCGGGGRGRDRERERESARERGGRGEREGRKGGGAAPTAAPALRHPLFLSAPSSFRPTSRRATTPLPRLRSFGSPPISPKTPATPPPKTNKKNRGRLCRRPRQRQHL